MTTKRVRQGGAGLLCALLVVAVPQVAEAAVVRIVDDNLSCAGATFNTIQAAVNAASSGDTIKVCPGSYPESVAVNKTLSFQGAKAGVDARTRTTTGESVVSGVNGGFDVQASGVVINGFTVKNAAGAPGIYLHGAYNGAKVANNIIRNNTMGVYANSSGPGLTTVSLNRFSDNNVDGAAAGNGIYSDQGLSGGRIKNNLFERNQNAGVLIAQTVVTVNDLVIASNRGVDNGSFAALFHGTSVEVKLNSTADTVPGDDNLQGSAIFIGGDSVGVTVAGNTVKDSPANGIAVRHTASGVTVQDNIIRRASIDGISISSSTPGAASIVSNDVMLSQHDGISLRDTTSGTTNTWTDNVGVTSSPPGLCTST